jgi:hypothetical protein
MAFTLPVRVRCRDQSRKLRSPVTVASLDSHCWSVVCVEALDLFSDIIASPRRPLLPPKLAQGEALFDFTVGCGCLKTAASNSRQRMAFAKMGYEPPLSLSTSLFAASSCACASD